MTHAAEPTKFATESASEREQRIKRRRDEAIAEVGMSEGQAETIVDVSGRPSTWFGLASSRSERASSAQDR